MSDFIAAHRLALNAYLTLAEPPFSNRFTSARATLRDTLQNCGDIGQYLQTTPPATLHLLKRAIGEPKMARALEFARMPVREALRFLTTPVQRGRTQFGIAQIWAYHALRSAASAKHLFRLGLHLTNGDAWRRLASDTTAIEETDATLLILRDPWVNTASRLAAIRDLSAIVRRELDIEWWAQIDHVLTASQYGWPLLVARNGSYTQAAVSVPFAIDVYLDPAAAPRVQEDSELLSNWRRKISYLARVAFHLWRSKHGNHGNFRDVVASAIVRADLSAALSVLQDDVDLLDVVDPKRDGIIDTDRESDRRSADAYIAQFILAKFLGRTNIMSSAVTATVENRVTLPDGNLALDYMLGDVFHIDRKIHYVFSSGVFERFVVPKTPNAVEAVNAARATQAQTCDVFLVDRLSIVADCVQTRGWRQYNYIRCPDVAWSLHGRGRPRRLPPDDEGVSRILQMLSASSDAILRLRADAITLGSALWRINAERTLSIDAPPSLWWTFIRLQGDESAGDVIQLIWKAVGGRPSDLDEILKSSDSETAILALARALNNFEPSSDRPGERAPDVLVLATRPLEDTSRTFSDQLRMNDSTNPFAIDRIVATFSQRGLLRGPFDERFLASLGRTRLVLLEEVLEPSHDDETVIVQNMSADDRAILRELAVFESNFSTSMAAVALHPIEWQEEIGIRQLLDGLVSRELLNAWGLGYFVPDAVKSALAEDDSGKPMRLWERHMRAGKALTPFAVSASDTAPAKIPYSGRFSGAGLDLAFEPEVIQEASRHFVEASRQAVRAGGSPNSAEVLQARSALGFLTRFGAPASWDMVARLLGLRVFGPMAFEVATELLEDAVNTSAVLGPKQLLLAARAAAQHARSSHSDRSLTADLVSQARDLFERSLVACENTRDETIRLAVIGWYAMFAAAENFDNDARILQLEAEGRELLLAEAGGQVTRRTMYPEWVDWVEKIGDLEADNDAAAAVYAAGLRIFSSSRRLYVRWLGCQDEAAVVHDPQFDAAQLSDYCKKLIEKPVLSSWSAHSSRRIENGLRIWNRFAGGSADEIEEFISKIRSKLQPPLSPSSRKLRKQRWRSGPRPLEH